MRKPRHRCFNLQFSNSYQKVADSTELSEKKNTLSLSKLSGALYTVFLVSVAAFTSKKCDLVVIKILKVALINIFIWTICQMGKVKENYLQTVKSPSVLLNVLVSFHLIVLVLQPTPLSF